MHAPTHRPSHPRSRLVLFVFVFVFAVACASLVPRHGWTANAGPVVPHDSFPADCSLCHTGDDWHTLRADFTFDHEQQAGLRLDGAHAQAPCLLCHNDRGPVAEFAARGCAGCHQDPHLGRLGAQCRDCHHERTWTPHDAIARHDLTRFPLVGAHAAAACFRCHPGAQLGNFAGASSDCVHCHQDAFARTRDPDHTLGGFSPDCATCHTALAWRPARFVHPSSFPLRQGHAGRNCRDCHQTPNSFTGLSPDCRTCHLDRYLTTQNPPHVAFGLSQDCQQCHSPAGWGSGNWNHPFPIQTGRHAGLSCFACHDNPANRPQFTCTNCHDHEPGRMQDKHDDVPGYVYATPNCFTCHPTGR
jgi:hypothetical protein